MSKQGDKIIDLTRLIEIKMGELEQMKAKVEQEGRRTTSEERDKANEILKEVKVLTDELDLEKHELDVRQGVDKSQRNPIKPEMLHKDKAQEQFPGLPPKEMRFDSFGEQLQAVMRASDPSMPMDRRLIRAATGMGKDTPTDGGFLVQQDFAQGIINRVYDQSPVVSRVTNINIGANSNSIKLNAIAETSRASSIWGGIILYWLGEGSEKTDTKPEFRQIELSLHKVAGLYYATDELLADAAALASIAEAGFAQALDVELERVIMRGTGAGQPLGILNAPCLISVAKETGQAAATIQFENIINMWARLWSRSQGTAVWCISQSILPQLMTMGITIGTAGAPVWLPPNGISGAPYGTLLGRPIFPIENCSVLGTQGDIILADFSEYLFARKGAPQMASSIHVRFIYDESTFRLVFRCDGQPAWNAALTPKDSSNTVGPFITLDTRS
jgi:HK97 family phage major capsid protein